jgi:hypothetical protein
MTLLDEHIKEDQERYETMQKILFGDENSGELGMTQKVDAMYEILVSAKTLISILDSFGKMTKWIVGIGLAFALFKGWLVSLIHYLLIR